MHARGAEREARGTVLLIAPGILLAIVNQSNQETVMTDIALTKVGSWDLHELQRAPQFERLGNRRVQEFDRSILVSELYFEVAPFLGKPARAFGWLAMPEAPAGKLPAMLLIHGGGGTAIEQWARDWASRGFAALAIDLYGQGPDRKRLPDGGCDWSDMELAFGLGGGVDNSWIYQAVAAGIRAVSVLRAQPEVNPQQLGVTGVSWGGYLTNTIMCVDDHVALGIPVCGCGFDRRAGNLANASPEQRRRVFELFDASNYSDRCAKPVLWVGGVSDPPPDQLMKCYNAVPDQRKTLSIRLVPGHNHPAYMGTAFDHLEPAIFADSVFRGAAAMPKLGLPQRNGRCVTAACESAVELFRASVMWTQQTDQPWAVRKWNAAPATVQDGVLSAQLETDDPAVLYAIAVDMRGALSSSPFVGIWGL